MHTTFALAAFASVASAAIGSSPSSPPPPGCSTTYSGAFQITIINSTTPVAASKVKRQASCGQSGLLTTTLNNGILKDSENRQGEIVANYQFQFDNPLQTDAVYTEGFSVCNNGSLALGGTNIFYQCQTFGGPGIGNYSNLYSQSTGAQCQPVLINILPCGSGSTSSAGVGQSSDGQITATSVGTVSQITDGQIQATGTAGSVAPVSQISDGQIQVTTVAPGCIVSQISDGQLQATICPTGAPVSQISDGQIQATTTGAPVSQISDGQIQATATATGAPVSQISDGQIQATGTSAPNATSTPLQVVTAAGNGLAIGSTFAAMMVGIVAVVLL